MEEEIKEMKKIIKIYNNFILFEPILKGPLLFFIAIANITVLILGTRRENGILWLFLAGFLCGLMILFYTFWNWNYNLLFLGKRGIVQRYFEMNKKYFSKKDMKKIYLKEFLEKEGLEGLPLDSGEIMKFLEWRRIGIERLQQDE